MYILTIIIKKPINWRVGVMREGGGRVRRGAKEE